MNSAKFGMLIQLLVCFIQSNKFTYSANICNTSSFFLTNVTKFKSTRPLNITFKNPDDRCDVFFSVWRYVSHVISTNCSVLSNPLVYPRKLNNQQNILRIDDLSFEDFYIYAYNCTKSLQNPDSISISWTKIDEASMFPSVSLALLLIYVMAIPVSILGSKDIKPLKNNIATYYVLLAVAALVLIFQESLYLESIDGYQKANLVIWALMNSLIVLHMLLFVSGFKSAFQDYSCSHLLKILLICLSSFALNLFNSLAYFYFDLNKFLIISMICIPITVLIELVPFIVLWIRLSLQLKEVCNELFSRKLSDPDFDINYIYSNFHWHNALCLILILMQCMTPMYVYFYSLSTIVCFFVAFAIHFFVPGIIFLKVFSSIKNIYECYDDYLKQFDKEQCYLLEDTEFSQEREHKSNAYGMAMASFNMATAAYNVAKEAYNVYIAAGSETSLGRTSENASDACNTCDQSSNTTTNISGNVDKSENNLEFHIGYSLEDNLIP